MIRSRNSVDGKNEKVGETENKKKMNRKMYYGKKVNSNMSGNSYSSVSLYLNE